MILKDDENLIKINHNLELVEKRDGLTFGTDAYLLSAYVRPNPKAVCADLGSGTGVIALLLLARGKVSRVHSVEIQPDFAELISRNAEHNGLSDRILVHSMDVRELTDTTFGGTVDIVVSNPPYMKCTGKANEKDRKNIARHETAGGVMDFCAGAGRVLRHGGLFYGVWRPDRISELVGAMVSARIEPKRMTFVHARADLPPCLVLFEGKKCAAAGCYLTPPLIMYREGTSYTDTLRKIYEEGDFGESYKRP